jgi:polyisoprenoid-binding protein YceI
MLEERVRYRIDSGVSTFTVQAFATGLLSAFGHSPVIAIRDFAGEAGFKAGTLEDASVEVIVKAASLEVKDDIRAKDRREIEEAMRAEVLDVRNHPEIVFRSLRIQAAQRGGRYDLSIDGRLTLRGVTRDFSFPAQAALSGDTLRSWGSFTLRQSDYGIRPVSAAGGTLKLKDELKFTFEIVARRVKE